MPLCEILGDLPLGAWDIKRAGTTIGVLVINGSASADSGFGAKTENWHWDQQAWADDFVLVERSTAPDKADHTGWETYPHVLFAGSVDLPATPATKTWRLTRKPAGQPPQDLDVFVRRVASAPRMTWWAKPAELDGHLLDPNGDDLVWEHITAWPGGTGTSGYETIDETASS